MATLCKRKSVGNLEYFFICSQLVIIPKQRTLLYVILAVFLALNILSFWVISNMPRIWLQCLISTITLWTWMAIYLLIFCSDPGLPGELLDRLHRRSDPLPERGFVDMRLGNGHFGDNDDSALNAPEREIEAPGGRDNVEINLEEAVPHSRFCKFCRLEKGPGTRHCRACQVCVEGFDHHCMFLLKCVGRGNKLGFYALIVTSLALFASQARISLTLASE